MSEFSRPSARAAWDKPSSSRRSRGRGPGVRRSLFALVAFVTLAAAACTQTPATPGGGSGDVLITASSSTISYGDAVPAITPWYSGLPGGQLQTATPATCTTTATATSPAGTYPTSCSGAVNGSSTITYVNGTITIEPAQVEVTASGGAMVVGGSVPTITASYSGLVNDQTAPAVLPTCSTTATSASVAGNYPSTCSGASDPNYSFSYEHGTVSVGAALVTVTASSRTTAYGKPAAITATYSGFVHGETRPATAASCNTTATTTSPVGSYTSACSGAADPSYVFSYVNGTVTVTPAPVVVTASSATMPSTGAVPDHHAELLGPGQRRHRSGHGADVFHHGHVVEPDGSLPVDLRRRGRPELHLLLRERRHHRDGRPGSGDGHRLVGNGHTTAVRSRPSPRPTRVSPAVRPLPRPAATCTTTATSSSPVGTYPTTCSGAADPSYGFVYVAGSVTITRAPATVTASSGSFTYGGSAPAITPTYSGLVNGDDRSGHGTDVFHHGHVLEPGRLLPLGLPRCRRSELHLLDGGRLGQRDQGRPHGHGVGRFVRLRRFGARDHGVLRRVRERRRRPGHPADLFDGGHLGQPGGVLRLQLFGRQRSELHLQLRRRFGQRDPEGGGDHGVEPHHGSGR